MTKLSWDDPQSRIFEIGVDRGVLYKSNGNGVAWNGLTSISESSSGGEASPYFIDGVKYLNLPSFEQFGGTIQAYTYPDEFAEYDGTAELYDGLSINLQERKPFGLSYRTLIGSSSEGISRGYKIHIIYNILAAPSQKAYTTMSNSLSPLVFSWSFSTSPVAVGDSYRRTAHVTIDSTKAGPGLMRSIENYLYGSKTKAPKLIDLDTLIYWFEGGGEPFEIVPDRTNGLAELISGVERDLVGSDDNGLYVKLSDSRLKETPQPGLYKLET